MKIANTIIGVTAVLILLMAVAVPIITDMQQSSTDPVYSENATGDGYLMKKDTSASIALLKTSDGVTANGTAVTSGYAIVTSTAVANVTSQGFQVIYKSGSTVSSAACNTATDAFTVTSSGWTLSYAYTDAETSTTSTVTASNSYSWVYYKDDAGTYLNAAAPVLVDGDSTFVVYGTTLQTGRMIAQGTIDGGLSPVINYYSTPTFTISAEETDYTMTLNSVTISAGGSSSTLTSNFIVPVEYTSGYEESTMSSLVGIIPVILITALIVAIVARVLPNLERGRE